MTDSDEIARLRTKVSYDPSTGHLRWIERPKRVSKTGLAGCVRGDGYVQISVGGTLYLGHRLAWALHHGEWPPEMIDHINGNPNDNRLNNLRLATVSDNMRNKRRKKSSVSGAKGVSWCRQTKKWKACIAANGRQYSLGRYRTVAEAAAVYAEHALRLHGEFAKYDDLAELRP